MKLDVKTAEAELEKAGRLNPGPWTEHSRYVAEACRNIAEHCEGMCAETAYCLGMLHDIGRYAGVTSEKHLIDGYRYCKEKGWDKAAQICISHAFIIQDIATAIGKFDVSKEEYEFIKQFVETAEYDDYDRLVQLCDALALPSGFCLMEKRFVDVFLRYGNYSAMVERFKKLIETRNAFEEKIGSSIYDLLPGVVENTFSRNA